MKSPKTGRNVYFDCELKKTLFSVVIFELALSIMMFMKCRRSSCSIKSSSVGFTLLEHSQISMLKGNQLHFKTGNFSLQI